MSRTVKCVCLGDHSVGKTTLLFSFLTKCFVEKEHLPSVMEPSTVSVLIDGKPGSLELHDSNASKAASEAGWAIWAGMDVIMLCFSVMNWSSLESVKNRWMPEVIEHCSNVCCLLVGTQMDFSSQKSEVSAEYAAELANELGIKGYCECSPLTGQGFIHVFNEVIRIGAEKQSSVAKRTCVIL